MPEFTISLNPATGEEIGKTPVTTVEELKVIAKKAATAADQWAAVPIRDRIDKIRRIRRYIVDHTDELAEIVSRDNGKTRVDALGAEIAPAAMAISYYCDNAERFLRDRSMGVGNIALCFKRTKAVNAPYGVIGIISPWNYPFCIPFYQIVMGLLAGNAVIFKAATETQMVGNALRECVEAAGLPEGVFNYVNMPGRVAGDAFLEAGIGKLFFTGSVEAGKYLMKKAADTLTPVCLELGGNDAMIVCEDANLDRAANCVLWAGFGNGGQSCGGIERIYVQEKVYDKFMDKLKMRVQSLRVGQDTGFAVDMGTMTTGKQAEAVKAHVEAALSQGAKLFAQSKIPDDPGLKNLLPAMVLTDVTHDMDVMKHETFGPVVGVMRFKDIDEAVELANDSYLGLTGSVWSKDRFTAKKIARRIKAGAVTINDHLMSHGLAETSWGGFKQSGIGRAHGEIGFREFTQPQMIVDDVLSFAKKQMWWQPYSKTVYDGLKGLLGFLYGPTIARRIKGTVDLLKIVPRMFTGK